jgi:sec-independent protein translocase protein TatB
MFEIGFQEILLIFVIALVVLGPEKLPRLAAHIGRWAGRAKSMARQFREQLESEVDLEQTLSPKPKPRTDAPPPPADDYSAAHDPASEAYATPAQEPLRDTSEDPPAVAPVPDPAAPAPVEEVRQG